MIFKRILLMSFASLAFFSKSSGQCSVSSTPSQNCASFGDQSDAITINGVPSPNSSGCSSGGHGGPFSTPGWSFIPGQANNFNIIVGGGTYSEAIAIWIDYNNNGFYENSEQVYASNGWATTHTNSFTIPNGVPGGNTYMRVLCAYTSSGIPNNQQCSNNYGTWGEYEDYIINICKPPTIDASPVDTFACEGGNTIFSVAATGAGNYQWQFNSGGGWTDVANDNTYSGATAATLGINNAPGTIALTKYRCIVKASCSDNVKDTSEEATLDILPNVNILTHTDRDTSCIGVDTRLTIKDEGINTTYRWQIWDNISGMFIDVPPAPFVNFGDTLLIQSISDTLDGARMRCIVEGTCGADTTSDILLFVNPLPTVITSPEDLTLNNGATAMFQVIASGVNIKYRWQAGYQGNFAFINDNGIYKGVNTDRLTVKGVSRAQDGLEFRCVILGAGSCAAKADTSNAAVLSVNPPASVEGIAKEESFMIYPNPVSGDKLMIRVNTNYTNEAIEYTIHDKMGRLISNGTIDDAATGIPVGTLGADVYSIQLIGKQSGKSTTHKFSKL